MSPSEASCRREGIKTICRWNDLRPGGLSNPRPSIRHWTGDGPTADRRPALPSPV